MALVLNHTVCSDQWRHLASGVGSVDLSTSGGPVILDHLNRAGDGVRIQLPLELWWWAGHLCRASREASWVRQLCTSHLWSIVGCLLWRVASTQGLACWRWGLVLGIQRGRPRKSILPVSWWRHKSSTRAVQGGGGRWWNLRSWLQDRWLWRLWLSLEGACRLRARGTLALGGHAHTVAVDLHGAELTAQLGYRGSGPRAWVR